ncbi:MAG: hypothetical protein KC933_37665, partial [Myxococcales bacterium]|nr:hypothetical protein [Myxococcales bacterium]
MVALKREKVRALVGRRTLIPTAGEGVTLRLDLTHAVIPELRAALDEELAMVAARPVEGLVAPLRLATGADHVQLALEPIHGGALRLADMLRGLGRRGEGLGDGLAAALTATATQLCHKIHLGPGHAGAPRAHAALHPGTLLLTPAGTVALLGCGLPGVDGLLIPAEPEPELQSAAPELMRGQRPDALSDVYALGALYLTLLSGQPPWGGRSEGEIRAALGRGQVPPLPGALPDPRPSLVTLLRRALAPTPGDRFPTALALGQAISRELKDSGQPRASAETLTRMLATAVPADALRGPEILLGRPAPTAAGPAPTEGDLHRGWSMVLQEPGSSPSGPTLPRPAEVMTAPTSRPTPPAT